MKEILFYSAVYDFTVAEFIEKLNEIPKDEDVSVRLNSPGGSVWAGWGLIGALKERTGKNYLKIDGNASSMAFFMVPFFDDVQALDVTSFMVHRADGRVQSEDDQKWLNGVNSVLRAKLEARVDGGDFLAVTGTSIKDLFEAEERKNVWITAKQAKKLGLVDRVVRLDPREVEAMKKNLVAFSDMGGEAVLQEPQGSGTETAANIINNETKKDMTKNEVTAQFPDVATAFINEGIELERKRVRTILKFSHIDAKACATMVAEGSEPDSEFFADMQLKAISAAQLQDTEEETVEVIEVDPKAENDQPVEETQEIKQSEFVNKMRAGAGLKEGAK